MLALALSSCANSSRIRQERAPRAGDNCAALESAIRPWLGTPYLYGGTGERGLDCSAFVQIIYKQYRGIDLPRTTTLQYAAGERVQRGNLRCGDLVFFNNVRGRGVDHVGIYLGRDRFAHASTQKGVTVSDLNNSYYRKRYSWARRLRRP